MKDYLASIEKLRRDAAEAALIRDLATDHAKREVFDRLCQHFERPDAISDFVERHEDQDQRQLPLRLV